MFRKKSPSDELFLHFFFESSEPDRVFNYLHDLNSIFRAGGIKSEWVRARTVLVKGCDFHDPMYLLVLTRAQQKGEFSRSTEYTFLLSNFSLISGTFLFFELFFVWSLVRLRLLRDYCTSFHDCGKNSKKKSSNKEGLTRFASLQKAGV